MPETPRHRRLQFRLPVPLLVLGALAILSSRHITSTVRSLRTKHWCWWCYYAYWMRRVFANGRTLSQWQQQRQLLLPLISSFQLQRWHWGKKERKSISQKSTTGKFEEQSALQKKNERTEGQENDIACTTQEMLHSSLVPICEHSCLPLPVLSSINIHIYRVDKRIDMERTEKRKEWGTRANGEIKKKPPITR